MSVRHLRPTDRSEWLRMLLGLYPGTMEEEHAPDVDAYLAGHPAGTPPHAAVFVYEFEGEEGLCGFLELSVRNYAEGCTGETPYVESWYVVGERRGQGIGRALIEAAEAWARERGYRAMASDTDLGNLESLRAHQALGFEEVERAIHFRKSLD